MERKSSRGNPYHDEKGRFTTAGGCKKKVDYKSEYDYMVQTAQRKRAENPPPKVNAYVVSDGEAKVVFGNEIQEGMIVEYDPAWAEPGHEEAEAKYIFVAKNVRVNEKGKGTAEIVALNGRSAIGSIQSVDAESIRPASVEKVDATEKAMSLQEREKLARVSGWNKGVNNKSQAADYLSKQEYVESVNLHGGNLVDFEYAGIKHEGYIEAKDGKAYFKPSGGKEYVTVDRYISTQEYTTRYDYVMERHDTAEFTEIVGSIGGDVERVRIYNDGKVGVK